MGTTLEQYLHCLMFSKLNATLPPEIVSNGYLEDICSSYFRNISVLFVIDKMASEDLRVLTQNAAYTADQNQGNSIF